MIRWFGRRDDVPEVPSPNVVGDDAEAWAWAVAPVLSMLREHGLLEAGARRRLMEATTGAEVPHKPWRRRGAFQRLDLRLYRAATEGDTIHDLLFGFDPVTGPGMPMAPQSTPMPAGAVNISVDWVDRDSGGMSSLYHFDGFSLQSVVVPDPEPHVVYTSVHVAF